MIGVPVALGRSALYSSYQVISASSGGVLVTLWNRSGDGLLQRSDAPPSRVLAGGTMLSALHPTYPAGYESVGIGISGSMVTDFEVDFASGKQDVWWDDTATGKWGMQNLPTGLYPVASAPDGFLVADAVETTIEHVDVLTGARTTLIMTKSPASVTAGPSGAVVTAGEVVRYVTYSPVRVSTLEAGGEWECDSVSSDAAGCDEYNARSRVETVGRFPLPSGKPVTQTLPAGPDLPVIVTPKVTAWVTCGSTGCTLRRVPAAGGDATSIRITPVSGGAGGVQVVGDTFYWGQLDNRAPNGGLLDMADSARVPSHVASAPLSPLEAANVSVSGDTVSWIDNAEPGLGIWTRSIAGASTVTLGKPDLIGQAGFVYTDTSYGLALGSESPGPTVVYSRYRTQPTRLPLALWVRSGRHSTKISAFEHAEADADLGPSIDVSGSWVLYEASRAWHLYNTTTHRKVALPTGIQTYALGGGEVAWVAHDGSVWEEPAGTRALKRLAGALAAGGKVDSVDGLAVDGSTVAWSYEWSNSKASGAVADYVDPAVSPRSKRIPDPGGVFGFALSADYVGFELYTRTGETIEVINLPSGSSAERLVTRNGFDLSISGRYAAWIGGHSLRPFVGAL